MRRAKDKQIVLYYTQLLLSHLYKPSHNVLADIPKTSNASQVYKKAGMYRYEKGNLGINSCC